MVVEELQVRERSGRDMRFYRWVVRERKRRGGRGSERREKRGMRVRQPRIMIAGIMK